MKTLIFICTIAFSAACLLAGCEKENTEISDGGIRFTANGSNTFNICETPTRVTLYNNATDFKNSGVSFAVFGNNEDYSEELFKEKIVTKEGDYYKPSVDYVWDGTYINVYAVAPYNSGTCPSTISNPEVKVVINPYDGTEKYMMTFHYQALSSGIKVDPSTLKDIMVGYNQNSHISSGFSKTIGINFYHVLSGVKFIAGNSLAGVTVKSISLVDFEAVGDYIVKINDSGIEEIKCSFSLLEGTSTYTNRYIYENNFGDGETINNAGDEIGNTILIPHQTLFTSIPPYYPRIRVVTTKGGIDKVYSNIFPNTSKYSPIYFDASKIYNITIDIDDYKYTRSSSTDGSLRLSVTSTPMD